VNGVLLAQEFDAVENGQPYVSVNRRRIFTPDTRSRMYGYLATARVAAPGFRTDGTWVWPERIAEQARAHGVAPQDQLFEHMRERYFLLPDEVSEDALWDAAVACSGPATAEPPPEWEWTYYASYLDPDAPAARLYRSRLQPDGSTREQRSYGMGWHASYRREVAQQGFVEVEPTPVSGRIAAQISNQLCDKVHASLLDEARESVPANGLLRLARVFDGQSPSGAPWFSPGRLRLPEGVRRQRIAAYLTSGRLVVRAAGLAADPLVESGQPVVALNYRTDGTWVWQEALAYYVLTRGAAPELEFLCHLEERGLMPAADVPDEVASAAAALATTPPPAPRERVLMTYYQDPDGVVCRARHNEYLSADAYRMDRRWGSTSDLADQFMRGEMNEYEPVSEAEAVRTIDARWARDDAQPPFD
jgi:hypothetical protein